MIDWQALAQIDAPRCFDWRAGDSHEAVNARADFMLSLSMSGYSKIIRNSHASEKRDEQDTVDIITIDHLDAEFDEAAGYV